MAVRRILQPSSTFLFRASLLLFALSMPFSCYYLEGGRLDWRIFGGNAPGLLLLMIGWIGILTGEIAWIANPLWGLAVLFGLQGKQKTETDVRAYAWSSLVLGVAAQIFALTFLFQRTTQCGNGGVESEIGGYGPGYFLWISSIAVHVWGAATLVYEAKRTNAPPEPDI